jgi:hypothetical protein
LKKVNQEALPSMVCEKHGIIDVFPCPWPNCENGCSESKFEVITMSKSNVDKNEVFSRREWESPDGDVYYSWDAPHLPNWFSIEKVVWNEARRLGIINENNPDTIYHYTDLDGFKGMIDTSCIWLSDYSYLNDASELLHGGKLISEAALKMLDLPKYKSMQELIQIWIESIKKVNYRVCIASFSSDGDSLSQWRSYGSNIAVGFNTNSPIGYPSETHFKPVEYDVYKQEKLINLFLCHMCQAYTVDNSSGRLEKAKDIYESISRLIALMVFFKDSGFKDEMEYRIAYIEDKELFENIGVKISSKEFRVSQGKLIPYVKSTDLPTPMKEKCKINISSIVLGPGADIVLERGIREFLDYNGYEDVLIKKSCIPYRT